MEMELFLLLKILHGFLVMYCENDDFLRMVLEIVPLLLQLDLMKQILMVQELES